MLFKLLVVFHTLGATIWAGGHLILAIAVLPEALKKQDAEIVRQFEERFEPLGLSALLLQAITGLWLTWLYFPGLKTFFNFDSYLSTYIAFKFLLLLLTLGLAIHARFFIIPKLSQETLNQLAFHIVGVTTLAVIFVILGAGIRLGGFV